MPRFLPVPVGGREFGVTIKLSKRYQVLIDGCELSCHDKTVQIASKKQGTSASAGNPIDFVSAVGLVKVSEVE